MKSSGLSLAWVLQKALTDADSSLAFDILLGTSLMLVPHMHNRCGFRAVRLVAVPAFEILFDLASSSTNCLLVARTTFPIGLRDSYRRLMLLRSVLVDLERLVHLNGILICTVVSLTYVHIWCILQDL